MSNIKDNLETRSGFDISKILVKNGIDLGKIDRKDLWFFAGLKSQGLIGDAQELLMVADSSGGIVLPQFKSLIARYSGGLYILDVFSPDSNRVSQEKGTGSVVQAYGRVMREVLSDEYPFVRDTKFSYCDWRSLEDDNKVGIGLVFRLGSDSWTSRGLVDLRSLDTSVAVLIEQGFLFSVAAYRNSLVSSFS